MHYLLIQQAIIDEVVKLAFSQGNKALKDTAFNLELISPALQAKGIPIDEIEKWVAFLALDGYFEMTAESHHRNPAYVTISKKGLQAEISKYFQTKYDQLIKDRNKYWVDLVAQIIIGATAIIAILMSSKPCNKSQTEPTQEQSVNIYSGRHETILTPTRQVNKLYYDSVAQKFFYLDTFYVVMDTVFVGK